jgi:hypothetical protein
VEQLAVLVGTCTETATKALADLARGAVLGRSRIMVMDHVRLAAQSGSS